MKRDNYCSHCSGWMRDLPTISSAVWQEWCILENRYKAGTQPRIAKVSLERRAARSFAHRLYVLRRNRRSFKVLVLRLLTVGIHMYCASGAHTGVTMKEHLRIFSSFR